jgi:molybdopterin converting factor small subunit
MITVKMFGMVAEKAGCSTLELSFEGDTDQLEAWLHSNYPQLKGIKYALAVNKKIIHDNTLLKYDDEIALLPPFSGG